MAVTTRSIAPSEYEHTTCSARACSTALLSSEIALRSGHCSSHCKRRRKRRKDRGRGRRSSLPLLPCRLCKRLMCSCASYRHCYPLLLLLTSSPCNQRSTSWHALQSGCLRVGDKCSSAAPTWRFHSGGEEISFVCSCGGDEEEAALEATGPNAHRQAKGSREAETLSSCTVRGEAAPVGLPNVCTAE